MSPNLAGKSLSKGALVAGAGLIVALVELLAALMVSAGASQGPGNDRIRNRKASRHALAS